MKKEEGKMKRGWDEKGMKEERGTPLQHHDDDNDNNVQYKMHPYN